MKKTYIVTPKDRRKLYGNIKGRKGNEQIIYGCLGHSACGDVSSE